jgi:antitoxin component HigA of HigAB toxin-antitoxin module
VTIGKKSVEARHLASEAELDHTIARIDALLDRGNRLSRAEENELEALSDLVRAYEQKHYPVPATTNGEVLGYLIDVKGISLRQLAQATKIPYQVLLKSRGGLNQLAANEIQRLARYFRVKTSLFNPPATKSTKKVRVQVH